MRYGRGAIVIGAAVVVVVSVLAVVLVGRDAERPIEDSARHLPQRPSTAPVVADEGGCAPGDRSDRPFRAGAETGPIVGRDPVGGRVCAYDRGRLVGSQLLAQAQATELADAVRGGVDGLGPEGLGCPRDAYDYRDGYAEPHFTAHLTYSDEAPTDLWVYGNVCTPAGVVNNVGRFLRLGPGVGDVLGRLVRTPTPFPVTDPQLSPGPVPSGPMTDAECPAGINSGVPDWFSGEPVRRAADRRAIEMSAEIRSRYPDVRLRQAGFTATMRELSLIRAGNTRVGWFRFERVGAGEWSLRDWQSC